MTPASIPRYIFVAVVVVIGVIVSLFFLKTNIPSSDGLVTANFDGVPLNIEFAATDETRQRGLGGRESIPSDYGMLFVFPKSDRYGFWMKDMLVPLDMFWLDEGGRVVYMAQNVATSSYPNVFYPTVPALYVLETAADFASAHGIATGTLLQLKICQPFRNTPIHRVFFSDRSKITPKRYAMVPTFYLA